MKTALPLAIAILVGMYIPNYLVATIYFSALLLIIALLSASPILVATAITIPYVRTQLGLAFYAAGLIVSLVEALQRGEPLVSTIKELLMRRPHPVNLLTNTGKLRKVVHVLILASLISYVSGLLDYMLQLQGAEQELYIAFVSTLVALIALIFFPSIFLINNYSYVTAIISLGASWITPLAMLYILTLVPPPIAGSLEEIGVELGKVEAILERRPLIKLRLEKTGKGFKWWWKDLEVKVPLIYNPLASINPHTVILGTSGSGKSRLAARIVAEISSTYDVSFLIIDPHGEYSAYLDRIGVEYERLDAAKIGVNPFILVEGETPRDRAKQIVDAIRSLYNIGPLQASILEEAIVEAYANHGLDPDEPYRGERVEFPTPLEVSRMITTKLNETPTTKSLVRYIHGFFTASLRAEVPIIKVLRDNIVLDLHGLATRTQQYFYVDTLLRLLLDELRREGPVKYLRKIILVDEAQNFLPRTKSKTIPPLTRIFAEMRKYGLVGILVAQNPLDIDETILVNAAIKIILNLQEPKSVKYAAELLAGYNVEDRVEAVKAMLVNLKRGYAVIKLDAVAEPLLTRLKPAL